MLSLYTQFIENIILQNQAIQIINSATNYETLRIMTFNNITLLE